jgi:hypothetical protein
MRQEYCQTKSTTLLLGLLAAEIATDRQFATLQQVAAACWGTTDLTNRVRVGLCLTWSRLGKIVLWQRSSVTH